MPRKIDSSNELILNGFLKNNDITRTKFMTIFGGFISLILDRRAG